LRPFCKPTLNASADELPRCTLIAATLPARLLLTCSRRRRTSSASRGPAQRQTLHQGDFKINMRDRTITCPAGETESIDLGADVEFSPPLCARCRLRTKCHDRQSAGSGRTVTIADDELLQHRLRKLMSSAKGRERIRERVAVEHRLAHLGRRQGRRARYRGTRKNLSMSGGGNCAEPGGHRPPHRCGPPVSESRVIIELSKRSGALRRWPQLTEVVVHSHKVPCCRRWLACLLSLVGGCGPGATGGRRQIQTLCSPL